MADGWEAANRASVYRVPKLPPANAEDRLFFILTYLKTYALQVVQGRLFGMVQSKAHRWIYVLLPALLAALRTLGDAPARSLPALAQRLDVSEVDAAMVVAPLEEAPPPLATAPTTGPAPPFAHDGTERRVARPQTLLHRPSVRAARKKITP